MHATGITNLNSNILTKPQLLTSTTHILSSSYRKTIARNQAYHIQYMKVFIIPILDAYHIRTNFIAKANYHAVIKDSQNNISEA